jgi:aspartate/methionine/tyrosine aminotransferase
MKISMKETPINIEIVDRELMENGIKNVGRASIREIKRLIDSVENKSGERFIRMEMGIPGLPPSEIAIEAEIAALRAGKAAVYPDIYGTPELKKEISRFCKLFLNIDVNVEGCIPTVGSMMGAFASFLTINRMYADRDGTLFLDPGFPVHKQQCRILGQKCYAFDVYDHRGEKLRTKMESIMSTGKVSSILYSNPNNPSWICFTDRELKIIAELADKYNVIVLEDLAYFGMDFRKDYSKPGQPPYQPSVAHYTDNYILLISSSKAFSYAGQRIGMMAIADKVFNTVAPDLKRFYAFDQVGKAMIFGSVYAISSGTAHTPQYALSAMLKAVNDGSYNFVDVVKEYGEKAKVMKKMFTGNGFNIVYDKDEDKPIADGFYFTFSYPGFTGDELLKELLYYGISAISLEITGSDRLEGIRACVSLIQRSDFPTLEKRLKKFRENNPV